MPGNVTLRKSLRGILNRDSYSAACGGAGGTAELDFLVLAGFGLE